MCVKCVQKQEDKYESNVLPPIPEDSTGSSNRTITNSRRSSVWNRAISSLESRFQVSLQLFSKVTFQSSEFIVQTFFRCLQTRWKTIQLHKMLLPKALFHLVHQCSCLMLYLVLKKVPILN